LPLWPSIGVTVASKSGVQSRNGRGEGYLHAFPLEGALHRAGLRGMLLVRVKELAAGPPHQGLQRKHPRADMISVLHAAVGIVDGDAVADGIEHRLQLARLGAQAEVRGLQLLDLLLYLGVESYFGTLQAEQTVQARLVNLGAQYLLHQ